MARDRSTCHPNLHLRTFESSGPEDQAARLAALEDAFGSVAMIKTWDKPRAGARGSLNSLEKERGKVLVLFLTAALA